MKTLKDREQEFTNCRLKFQEMRSNQQQKSEITNLTFPISKEISNKYSAKIKF